jgi:hypothetical protein
MNSFGRGLGAATIGLSILLAGAAAPAQETSAPTITTTPPPAERTAPPPQLKNFSLPGEVTRPEPKQDAPAPQPKAATPQPQPKAATPAPAARTPTRAPLTPAPAARTADAPAAPRAPSATTTEAPAAPQPAPSTDAAPAPMTAPPAPPPVTIAPETPEAAAPEAPDAPGEEGNAWAGLWLALPALVALALFFGWGRFRRRPHVARRRVEQEEEGHPAAASPAPRAEPRPQPAAAPKPRPAPARAPAPAPQPVAAAPRARLEVQCVPARAQATDTAAVVEFELVLKNVGDEPARNIRIDTRMFNASGESEIDAFLNGPIHAHSGSPHVTIPPGEELRLGSAIGLPKEEVRAIELQGRKLFVPVVATNVAYDWAEGGAGRTSLSWLVGREGEQPNSRMGAFRLDLGPRIYRSVGVRPMKLANVA